MPFCTQCGHQNPEGSRFCSQCGTRLEPAAAARRPATAGPGRRPARPPRRSPSAVPRRRPSTARSARSTTPTRPPSTRSPPAAPCWWCSAGPSAGSRFLLDTDVVPAGRHPESEIFLDDITVSRRHAEFRRTADGLPGRRRRQPQRHLRQPRPDRRGRAAAATRSRSASSGWSTSPATPDRAAAVRQSASSRARMSIGEVTRPAQDGVPRRGHLEDPVPRERGSGRARAHPVGLPEVLRAGHGAAPLHPARQREHYLPLKVIKEHLDAHRPWPGAAGADGAVRGAAGGARRRRLPDAESFAATSTAAGLPHEL